MYLKGLRLKLRIKKQLTDMMNEAESIVTRFDFGIVSRK